MEENRKRKVEIDQRMTSAEPAYTGAAGVFTPLPAQPEIAAESRRKPNRNLKTEAEIAEGSQGRMISAFPVEQSDQPISREDRVLTNRAAAYRSPEPVADQTRQNPYATAAQQTQTDRFAAYRKPAETTDSAMCQVTGIFRLRMSKAQSTVPCFARQPMAWGFPPAMVSR